jgi:hypothetical protein
VCVLIGSNAPIVLLTVNLHFMHMSAAFIIRLMDRATQDIKAAKP